MAGDISSTHSVCLMRQPASGIMPRSSSRCSLLTMWSLAAWPAGHSMISIIKQKYASAYLQLM